MLLLNEQMEFGHLVRIGYAERPTKGIPSDAPKEPEMIQYVDLDEDGGAPDPVAPKGWEYLTGFTGQYGYRGPVMHDSEFIGGDLEDHIRSHPGYYVSVIIEGWTHDRVNHSCPFPQDCDEEAVSVGWGVLYYIGEKE